MLKLLLAFLEGPGCLAPGRFVRPKLITQLGTPARAAVGLGYITGLCELSPPSETALGFGIIMGPQQMVEANRGSLQLWDT